jgi:uncharacterized membrane protein
MSGMKIPLAASAKALTDHPTRCFLILSVFFGLVWTLLFPPFQTGDDYVHFYRAFAVSEGKLTCVRGPDGQVGGWLPRGLRDSAFALWTGMEWDSELTVDWARIKASFGHPMKADERIFVEYAQTASYTAVPYIPQAMGILVGRLANTSPVVCMYLGRLANLIVWVSLCAAAVRVAGRYGWLLFQLSLLPMSLALGCSQSADALTLGTAFLFFGLVVGCLDGDDPKGDERRVWTAGVVFLVMTLCKAYVPLWGIILICPAFLKTRRRLMISTGAGVAGVALLLAWTRSAGDVQMDFAGYTDREGQMAFILARPVHVIGVIAREMLTSVSRFTQFVGVLSWLNTVLPTFVYVAYGVLLLLVPLITVGRTALKWPGRLILLTIVLVTDVAVHIRLYIIATPVGAPDVWGVQGRYLLPCAALILLLLCNDGLRRSKLLARPYVGSGLLLANALLLAASTYRIVDRFYLP